MVGKQGVGEDLRWRESSTDYVSNCPGHFRGAVHVRKAVNALARYGDLLKVGGEKRHVSCAKLFTLAR